MDVPLCILGSILVVIIRLTDAGDTCMLRSTCPEVAITPVNQIVLLTGTCRALARGN